jgi:curved DNA-binding protein
VPETQQRNTAPFESRAGFDPRVAKAAPEETIDHYEFLQISPNADVETIHRVYRFLAARLHPDNPKTGDPTKFRQLKAAYDVLSDRSLRAKYDATRMPQAPPPFSTSVDFMDDRQGELNRRLAVLVVLYHRRRLSPLHPEVSLAMIEDRMGFPRDYLDFTLWYLHKKGYISKADNAQFTLTADGVDFVEAQRGEIPVLNKMLTSGAPMPTEETDWSKGQKPAVPELETHADIEQSQADSGPIILPASMEQEVERRAGKPDRRVGAPDRRAIKVERRFHGRDRREHQEGPRHKAN